MHALALLVLSVSFAFPQNGSLEPVQGRGCYTYGDSETPGQAHRAALALAQQDAVRSFRVYVESLTTVRNSQLEDDIIESASVGVLEGVKTQNVDEKGRQVCIAITARVDPTALDKLITQRVNARKNAETVQAPVAAVAPSFGLKVWTNKTEGRFVEGERLTIFVQSSRDAYLKLDYFQADGSVVHLVPNLFRSNAFIRAGTTYTFGDNDAEAFIVSGPFGNEAIKAIASTASFDSKLVSSAPQEEAAAYLNTLGNSVRGIRTAASAEWSEASILLTTISKDAAVQREDLAKTRR